jgi:hypothetical protein
MSRAYSAVEIGRAFEFHAARYLNNVFQMSLLRVGKAGDEGVDLRGYWYLPPSRQTGETGPSGSASGRSLPAGARPDDKGESSGSGTRRLSVVGQCKAERGALGAKYVREMEGVMGHLYGECVLGCRSD